MNNEEYKNGWNECVDYLINHVGEFRRYLLDDKEFLYFPEERIKVWFELVKIKGENYENRR